MGSEARAPGVPAQAPAGERETTTVGLLPHGHLWTLPDGTGLHAPPQVLTVDSATGRICCHLCGNWFRSLGSHVRVHGHTATTTAWRWTVPRSGPHGRPALGRDLAAASLPTLRAHTPRSFQRIFADGRDRLPRGLGSRRSRAQAAPTPTSAAATRQAEARAAGLETRRARQAARLAAVVSAAGVRDLSALLRTRYDAGASLESLARETGLGREALRTAMREAGIRVRATGQNTEAGRRSRALRADREVARLVGTDDLPGWLRDQRAGRVDPGRARGSHWPQHPLGGLAPGPALRLGWGLVRRTTAMVTPPATTSTISTPTTPATPPDSRSLLMKLLPCPAKGPSAVACCLLGAGEDTLGTCCE